MRIDQKNDQYATYRASRAQRSVAAGKASASKAHSQSSTDAASVNVSHSARTLHQTEQLLNQQEVPRQEGIARAKALLQDWQGPDDAVVDQMMDRLFGSDSPS